MPYVIVIFLITASHCRVFLVFAIIVFLCIYMCFNVLDLFISAFSADDFFAWINVYFKKKTTTTTINPPPDQVMLCFYLYLVLILFEAKFHEIKQCSIKGYKQEGILIVTHCNTLQRKLKYGLYVAGKCFLQIRMSKLCQAVCKATYWRL